MTTMHPRTDAMVNGMLISLGLAGIIDNLLIHWILGLHRLGPWGDPFTFYLEAALVILGALLVVLGLVREWHTRHSS